MKMSFGGSEMSFSDWKMSFLVLKAVVQKSFNFLVDSYLQIESNISKKSRKKEFLGQLK